MKTDWARQSFDLRATASGSNKILTHFIGSFCLCAAALFVSSCATDQPARIYVGRPTIYTRERLVNTRLQDVQWLNGKLAQDAPSTFQGARSQSQFTGLYSGLQAQFDPMGGANAASMQQAAQSVQTASTLQNQVVTSALQQELADLQKGNLSYSNVLGTNGLMVSSNIVTPPSFAPPTNVAGSLVPSPTFTPLAATSNVFLVNNNPVQLTAEEQFRDMLAYRDTVEAELNEKQLDDTHDHFGMTLYTFKFDVSILPGDANSALGRVDMNFHRGPSAYDAPSTTGVQKRKMSASGKKHKKRRSNNITLDIPKDSLLEQERRATNYYHQWYTSFLRSYDTESLSLQRRYIQGYLTDDERNTLVFRLRTLTKDSTESCDSKTFAEKEGSNQGEQQEMQFIARNLPAIQDQIRSVSLGRNSELILEALDFMTFYRFKQTFRDIGHPNLFLYKKRVKIKDENSDVVFLTEIDTDPRGPADLHGLVTDLDNRASNRTFVYAVEPKEAAQNLSDSSALSSANSFSLALSAAIPQIGTSLGGFLNYVKQNQYLLETIKRKPLVAGYLGNQTNFGWILGPRFAIGEDLQLSFEQSTLQESVQATIAVPAWWSSVMFDSTSSWLVSKPNKSYSLGSAGTNGYVVQLRPNLEALTQAACELSGDSWFTHPQIHPVWDHDQKKWGYVLRSLSGPTQILIPGRNLWRNPMVFIGSQGTSNIQVLPDMEGIVATFNQINDVPNLSASTNTTARVDLRVVTSDGESILKNAVTIVSGVISNKQDLFISMSNFWAAPTPPVMGANPAPAPATNFIFKVNTNLLPSAYHNFVLTGHSKDTLAEILATNIDESQIPKGKLTFPLTKWPQPGHPTERMINVAMKSTPSSDPVAVLQGNEQTLVLFNDAKEITFNVTAPTVTISTSAAIDHDGTINVQVPDVAAPGSAANTNFIWHAYPGLQQAVQSNQVVLHLASGGTSADLLQKGYDRDKAQIVFAVDFNKLTNGLPTLNRNGASDPCNISLLVPAPDALSMQEPRWAIPSGSITIIRKDKKHSSGKPRRKHRPGKESEANELRPTTQAEQK